MLNKFQKTTEDQEIKQEEREIRREYFVFIPILIVVVGLIAYSVSKPVNRVAVELVPAQTPSGYWIVYDNGEVVSYGTAPPAESVKLGEGSKVVDAETAQNGLWVMTNKGAVTALAGAQYAGGIDSLYRLDEAAELVAMPDGRAYRIAGKYGPVYAFNIPPISGGEQFNEEIAAVVSTNTGNGYWIFEPNGQIATFGDAAYYGNLQLADEKVVDATSYSGGVLVLTNKGRLIILGDGENFGDLAEESLVSPVIDIDALVDDSGYRIMSLDGKVTSFGSAQTL